jgi:hypothetical protein
MANLPPTQQPPYDRAPSPNFRPLQNIDSNQTIQRGPSPYRPQPPGPGGASPNQRPVTDPRHGNQQISPFGRPYTPPGPPNLQTRPPPPGVSPSPPLPASFRPQSPSGNVPPSGAPPVGFPQGLVASQMRPPMSPGYRPVQTQQSTPGRLPSYPVQQNTSSGYQIMQSNSASPPPVESPVSPTGNRATSPPTGTHKPKRLYPKQINEAYTENSTYEQYQTFTPETASGITGQQLQPSSIQHQQPQQPQFFTPAGDQNYASVAPPVPAPYGQQYTQPQQQSSMASLTNQFSNIGLGGPSQVRFILCDTSIKLLLVRLVNIHSLNVLKKRHI